MALKFHILLKSAIGCDYAISILKACFCFLVIRSFNGIKITASRLCVCVQFFSFPVGRSVKQVWVGQANRVSKKIDRCQMSRPCGRVGFLVLA